MVKNLQVLDWAVSQPKAVVSVLKEGIMEHSTNPHTQRYLNVAIPCQVLKVRVNGAVSQPTDSQSGQTHDHCRPYTYTFRATHLWQIELREVQVLRCSGEYNLDILHNLNEGIEKCAMFCYSAGYYTQWCLLWGYGGCSLQLSHRVGEAEKEELGLLSILYTGRLLYAYRVKVHTKRWVPRS